MSKIGQKPVIIPSSVQIDIKDNTINVKGSKGQLSYTLPEAITIKRENDQLLVERKDNMKTNKSAHGLYRNLIANAVKGVEEGWSKKLEVVGTGFNVKMQGQSLAIKVGYSHTVVYPPVQGIQLSTEGNNMIIVTGADKELVGQIAFQIKTIRRPDVYKGKGLRYQGERVRLKAGKKAKTA